MGPASMEQCISSPVLSKNPVLIKAILPLVAWIQAFKFTEVLLSSSITPILMVLGGSYKAFSTIENNLLANSTSIGPCILGFTK